MQRAKLLDRRAVAFAVTLAIFALSGCLKIPESGVAVKAVTAGLVFGVPPLPEPVAPPGFEIVEEQKTPSPSPTKAAPVVQKPVQPPQESCPKASDQTFPEEEATTSVKGLPKEGLYRWRTTITTTNAQGVTQTSTSDNGKGIGGIKQLTATDSRFWVGEFRVRGGRFRVVVQEFEIVQDGGNDDGIFLTRINEYDSLDDTTATSFTPEPSIKVLPLPVRAGLTLGDSNAGVDGTSLAVLRQTGTITGRKRVDVCGVVIDSWFVDGDQQYTAPSGTSYSIDYNYSVATQFGGYIAFENIFESSTRITTTQNIGSLDRFAPLPAYFRS